MPGLKLLQVHILLSANSVEDLCDSQSIAWTHNCGLNGTAYFSEGRVRVNDEILTHLQGITAQEQAILGGRKTINRDIYMQGRGNIIKAKKLLAAGKLITIRPHTRFIHFPEHTHDYVEARVMVKAAYEHQGPVYMRFGRSAVPVIHQENF